MPFCTFQELKQNVSQVQTPDCTEIYCNSATEYIASMTCTIQESKEVCELREFFGYNNIYPLSETISNIRKHCNEYYMGSKWAIQIDCMQRVQILISRDIVCHPLRLPAILGECHCRFCSVGRGCSPLTFCSCDHTRTTAAPISSSRSDGHISGNMSVGTTPRSNLTPRLTYHRPSKKPTTKSTTVRATIKSSIATTTLSHKQDIGTYRPSTHTVISSTRVTNTIHWSSSLKNRAERSSSSPTEAPLSIVIGGVIGGLALLIFAALAIIWIRRRASKPNGDESSKTKDNRNHAGMTHENMTFELDIGNLPDDQRAESHKYDYTTVPSSGTCAQLDATTNRHRKFYNTSESNCADEILYQNQNQNWGDKVQGQSMNTAQRQNIENEIRAGTESMYNTLHDKEENDRSRNANGQYDHMKFVNTIDDNDSLQTYDHLHKPFGRHGSPDDEYDHCKIERNHNIHPCDDDYDHLC